MYKMSKEQIDNRMVIESKGLNRTSQQQFVSDLFKAFEAGYTVVPSGWQADKSVIKANKRKVVLYKKGYEVVDPKGSDVDKRDYLAEAKAAEQGDIIPPVQDPEPIEDENPVLPPEDQDNVTEEQEEETPNKEDGEEPNTELNQEENPVGSEDEVSEDDKPETETSEDVVGVSLKDTLAGLNSKEDLIAFASEHKLEYSEEEAKYPKKLKKVLASKL